MLILKHGKVRDFVDEEDVTVEIVLVFVGDGKPFEIIVGSIYRINEEDNDGSVVKVDYWIAEEAD